MYCGFAVVAAFIAPLAASASLAAILAAAGDFPWSQWGSHFLHEWAGEATGIVMLATPMLILLRKAPWSTKSHIALNRLMPPKINLRWSKFRDVIERAAEVVVLLIVTWAAYSIPPGDSLDFTYFVFLPIIWIAVRKGFERAALAGFNS
jgi:integral membrane sensor domain MASE1